MWIKQKVKNRAGEFEIRPVWHEPKKEEVSIEFVDNSTVPKKRGKKK